MRKRAPPKRIGYRKKYDEIKKSGFDVNISLPTTRGKKAIVTRYHRLLFGGYKSKKEDGRRKRTVGISSHFEPYKGKNKNIIKEHYPISATRIKSTVIPKGKKVVKVSKSTITLQGKYGTETIYRVDKKTLVTSPIDITSSLPDHDDYRIVFGGGFSKVEFDRGALEDEINRLLDKYGEDKVRNLINIVRFKTRNQGSNGDYTRAKNRNN